MGNRCGLMNEECTMGTHNFTPPVRSNRSLRQHRTSYETNVSNVRINCGGLIEILRGNRAVSS
ncbi:hypothetical protein EYF80_045708 [Liparis tanakae]|uniref:Uncharacterized protein n=1 Tax=Liparis tanakae TaxID=230148 RepID=A0A4Z2FUS5_9TELE|nr:hypothetical protein EYF80_045708 [Liparis tanakae]